MGQHRPAALTPIVQSHLEGALQASGSDIATLLIRNLHDVFDEGDDVRRRAVVDEIFTDDAMFCEPNGIYRGRKEIARIAGAIRATHPSFRYTILRAPEVLHEQAGRVQWVSGAPGVPPAYAGTDVIVARNGKIAAIYLFFDEQLFASS